MLVVAAGVLLGLFLSKKSNDSSPTIAQVADTTATRAPLPSATPAPPFVTSRSPPKNCSLAAAGEKITPPGTNRLAPPAGSPPYIGFSLEWGWDRPLPLLKRLNAAPTIIGGFLQSYAPGTWDSAAFALYTEAAYNMSLSDPSGGLVKPIVNLALMTDYTLDKLNETIMRVWAKEFKRVNEGMGVPIMLRFAHEFNGT